MLWFEPVEEKDWIDEVIHECFDWVECTDKYLLKKSIQKHMPKSKKVEDNDVREFGYKNNLSVESMEAILQFLRAFNLLD